MKNRLKHNVKFCKKGDILRFVKSDTTKETNIVICRCLKVYKSYTTQYKFRISEYNPNTFSEEIYLFTRNYTRPVINKYYEDGEIQDIDPSLLAKIKLMER